MTTSPATETELIAYMATLALAEQNGDVLPVLLEVYPYSALMIIGTLQMAMRHPGMSDVVKEPVQRVIDTLTIPFEGTLGAEIIRRGNNPDEDR